jgi:predicted DNA-binding transcriptional regulator AlpA
MATGVVDETRPAAGGDDPGPAALLIDIRQLSALLRRSVASLERDQAAGRLPAPVYVGGSRRWRRAEVEEWVKAGCPRRDRWEAARAVAR